MSILTKQVPNFITLLNLLSGCIASVLAVQGELSLATAFVVLGILFDFFDGFAARLLNVKSDLGLQLDSLADMVTSGLVPGLVMCQLLSRSIEGSTGLNFISKDFNWMIYIGLIITLGSAYRLAKFNIDDRQTDNFIGLPTPANALLILSLGLIPAYHPDSFLTVWIDHTYVLVAISIVSALLLNTEIRLFSLKFKNLKFTENWYRFFLILFSILSLIWLQLVAVPAIILVYILLSVGLRFKA